MYSQVRANYRFKHQIRSNRQYWRPVVLLALLALSGCGKGEQSAAGGWRGKVKELKIAITTVADASGQPVSVEPLQAYLERATGITTHVRQVSSIYTSSIQALASGQVDMASLAGGGYVNVREQVGKLVAPLLTPIGSHGELGYYSALVVRSDSPYHSLQDLKGKGLAVVDYNSTSGYLMPMHAMRQKGVEPSTFFSKVGLAGGHSQAVLAVYNKQYDAAWTDATNGTPESGFAVTTWERMASRGMIPKGSIRPIWFVGPVPNSSLVIRTDRPQELQDLLRGAYGAMPFDAPDVMAAMGSLPGLTYTAGSDDMFAEIAKLRKEAVAGERAAAGSAPRGGN